MIVKCGADGCLIADDDGERTLPAHDAPVVDTTGCGDAFCAGVIVARCAGWEIDDAARLGCATGALNMRGLGSDAGARDVDEALAFMRETPYREALKRGRLMPKDVDHDERREELLEAVWRRDRARRASRARRCAAWPQETGWSTGVLAHYFADKDDIIGSALRARLRADRGVAGTIEARQA